MTTPTYTPEALASGIKEIQRVLNGFPYGAALLGNRESNLAEPTLADLANMARALRDEIKNVALSNEADREELRQFRADRAALRRLLGTEKPIVMHHYQVVTDAALEQMQQGAQAQMIQEMGEEASS